MSAATTKLNQLVNVTALAVKGNPLKDGGFEETQFTVKELAKGEVLVKMTATSICHTDWALFDTDGAIPGHEMAGVVQAKADDVTTLEVGDRVAIGYQRSSCRSCEYCNSNAEPNCDTMTAFFEGRGGYATHVVWNEHFVCKIPEQIEDVYVAPLMCAGATVYNAMKQSNVKKGQKVAIVGIGGLGHLAVMMANKLGCKVTALSRKMAKKDEATGFGAHDYIDTTDEEQIKAAKKSFDFMLITSPAELNLDSYASMVKPLRGVLCIVGVPPSMKYTFGLDPIIINNIKITGSLVASPAIIEEMLQFCAENDVKPLIEVFKFSSQDAKSAIQKVQASDIRFRAVMKF